MADDPTTIADADPELERRLTALARLRDQVDAAPPVHSLATRIRGRRNHRFGVAGAVAAAAAVLAAVVVLAARPDGDTRVTAGDAPTPDAPTATTAPQRLHHHPSDACGERLPSRTLTDHGLEVTKIDQEGLTARVRISNEGSRTVRLMHYGAALVVAPDRMIRTRTDPDVAGARPFHPDTMIEPGEQGTIEITASMAPCPGESGVPAGDVATATLVATIQLTDATGYASGATALTGPDLQVPVPATYRVTAPSTTTSSTTVAPSTTTIPR